MPDRSARQQQVLPGWQGFPERATASARPARTPRRGALTADLSEITMPSALELCVRYGLTPSECRVALELAKGLSNEEVAAALGLSPHTARHHTSSVMGKLQLSTRRHVRQVLLGGGRAVA